MSQDYPKTEKLKSRTAIDQLFSGGKSIAKFPLRLVYIPSNEAENQIGVSVSKKHFKKAVDRNYIKRILRESYRKNKDLLPDNLHFKMMLLYQSKDAPAFAEVEMKVVHLFKKLADANR